MNAQSMNKQKPLTLCSVPLSHCDMLPCTMGRCWCSAETLAGCCLPWHQQWLVWFTDSMCHSRVTDVGRIYTAKQAWTKAWPSYGSNIWRQFTILLLPVLTAIFQLGSPRYPVPECLHSGFYQR